MSQTPFHFILFYFILFYFISFYFILFHFISHLLWEILARGGDA